MSCAALRVFAGDQNGREIIATRIIDLARKGIIDPAALHKRVLTEGRVRAYPLANRHSRFR